MKLINSNSKKSGWAWIGFVAVPIFCLLLPREASGQTNTVTTLTLSRTPVAGSPPVQESFIVTPTPSPLAVTILLPGTDGNIQLTPNPPDGSLDVSSVNFLVRTRLLFAGHGFYTISLDSATDFKLLPKGLTGEQGSAAHVSDVLAVIAWARSTLPGVPVWVVGTSRGTAGAFVAAQYSPGSGGPDGLVFAASINDPLDTDSVLMATLANISVPVLLLNDKGNACAGTLASGEPAVRKALTMSPKVSTELLPSGGLTALTDSCRPLSDHGFFGVEDTAIHNIALWIGSTKTALTSSGNPSTLGNPVTFSAAVAYLARLGTPTGMVTFKDLTTATTLGSAPLSSGTATLTTTALSSGTHSIVAMYGGDATSTASRSTSLVQQVN